MSDPVGNGDEAVGVRRLKILGFLSLWESHQVFSVASGRVGGLRAALGPDWLRNHNEFDENTGGNDRLAK